MIPAAVTILLASADVLLWVVATGDERFEAAVRHSVETGRGSLFAPGYTARGAALDALDTLLADAHREASESVNAVAQLTEDGASTSRREAATVRAATWRVRAATLAAVCREVAKLWPEVSL